MEKEVITSGKMTFKFIWHYLLYSLILFVITRFIDSIISDSINSTGIIAAISLILSGISIFIATKLSIKDIFGDKTLKGEDIKKYKRNIMIFFVICIVITLLYQSFTYLLTSVKIDRIAGSLTIADGADITEAINIAKAIELGIAGISAVVKSVIYILMIRYQYKYINKNN